jgi:3-phosphoshikimate 1-carboxyvinyltransferase
MSEIHNYLPSPDAAAMVEAFQLFGATIHQTPSTIYIEGLNGKISQTEDIINAGNSGIVLRFCTALGALSKNCVVITGDHSIRHQRPMGPLLSGLRQLNVSAQSMRGDDYAPVIIQGAMQSGKTLISGQDSQPVSALIIAAAFADGPIEIVVENPGEKPWIDLTLHWLDRLNIPYKREGYSSYFLEGRTRYPGFEYSVPGDLSSAAFPIAAALITQSEITVQNIDLEDPQGDKEALFLFKKMGAQFEIDKQAKTLRVLKGPPLVGTIIDVNNFIDAIPILAVVACFAKGETVLYNGAIARQKESNRLTCMATELKKMGAKIAETADGLRINGAILHGTHLLSYNDHRIAMSLAIAGLGADGITTISPIHCIAKTYPTFVQDFNNLGADITQ